MLDSLEGISVNAPVTMFRHYKIYRKIDDKYVGFVYASTYAEATAVFAENFNVYEFEQKFPTGIYSKLAEPQKCFVHLIG